MNTNCFGYGNRKCRILKTTQCKNNSCSFFKTKEEARESLNKAYARLGTLDNATQKTIADTYYQGSFPWLEAGDVLEG